MPGSADRASRGVARAARAARASAARAAAAGASAARRAARSPGVSTSSSSDGSRPTRTVAPAAWASAAWRAKEPGPKAGVSTVGGSSRSALVPEPWRSGTMTTPGAAEASSSSTSAGIQRRAVPGHEQDPLRAARDRRPHAAQRRRGLARLDGIVHPLDAAPSSTPRRADATTITPSSPRTAPSASSTSPTIAAASSARSDPGGPQALLRAPERLDGEDGDRTHRRARLPPQRGREHQRLERDPAAGVGVAHLHVGLERRHAARPLVADQAVDQALVVGDDPVRVQRMPGPRP